MDSQDRFNAYLCDLITYTLKPEIGLGADVNSQIRKSDAYQDIRFLGFDAIDFIREAYEKPINAYFPDLEGLERTKHDIVFEYLRSNCFSGLCDAIMKDQGVASDELLSDDRQVV